MAKTFDVRWTPQPERQLRSFDTMEEAMAFALTVVAPRAGSVDIVHPDRPTISVIAMERPRGR